MGSKRSRNSRVCVCVGKGFMDQYNRYIKGSMPFVGGIGEQGKSRNSVFVEPPVNNIADCVNSQMLKTFASWGPNVVVVKIDSFPSRG